MRFGSFVDTKLIMNVIRSFIHSIRALFARVSLHILVLQLLHNVMATNSAASSMEMSADSTSSASASSSASTSAVYASAAAAAAADASNDFYSTGRVGRRNALADILSEQHSHTSAGDLPGQLGAMTTRDAKDDDDVEGGAKASSSVDGSGCGSSSDAEAAAGASSGDCSSSTATASVATSTVANSTTDS